MLEFLHFENEVNQLIETIDEFDKEPDTASILEDSKVKTIFPADDPDDPDTENPDCLPLLKENIHRYSIAMSESSVDDESPFRDITYKLILERSLSTIDEGTECDIDELDESGMEDDEKLEISPSSKASSFGAVGALSSCYETLDMKTSLIHGDNEKISEQDQSPKSSDKESGNTSDFLEQREIVLNEVDTTFKINPSEATEMNLVTTEDYQGVNKYFAADLFERLSRVNENESQSKFFELRRWKPLESLQSIDVRFACSTPHSELTDGDYADCEDTLYDANKEIKTDDQLVLETQDKEFEINQESLLKEPSKLQQDDNVSDSVTSSSNYKSRFRVVKRRKLSWIKILRHLVKHEKMIAKHYELQQMLNVKIEKSLNKIDSGIEIISELIGELSACLRVAHSQLSNSLHEDSLSSSKISSCLMHIEE